MRRYLIIVLSFPYILASCQVGIQEKKSMASIHLSNELRMQLQGAWSLNTDSLQTIIIENDSISFFYQSELEERFEYRITDHVIKNTDTIKAPEGEPIFEIADGKLSDIYYLLGVDENEFSLMGYSNGQTIVYVRKGSVSN
jgi:hypothetical protein